MRNGQGSQEAPKELFPFGSWARGDAYQGLVLTVAG
jgi:hypothetical protein